MAYSDSHLHLIDYPDDRISSIIEDMRRQEVELAVNVAVDFETSRVSAAFAREHDCVVAAIGIHPWFAAPLAAAERDAWEELAASDSVKMLGEIGLDFEPPSEPPVPPALGMGARPPIPTKMPKLPLVPATPEAQQDVFVFELGLAGRHGLPVNVHCKGGAHPAIMEILRRPEHREVRGIAHGFDGDLTMLRDWLDLGFYIALGHHRVLLEPMAGLEEIARAIPLDRLVIETDANPLINERGALDAIPVTGRVASIRGMAPAELGDITTRNLKRLLDI